MSVKLTMVRYGVADPPEEFPTLREALKAADAAVEWNFAVPGRITMPTTVIGAGPVSFDSMQIYAMLELVREADGDD